MKLKKITFILFIIIYILFNLSIIIGITQTENTIDNYFRIHIVANSDNIDDQILKLNVSKTVDNHINSLTKGINNKSEIKQIVSNNINDILNITKNVISDYGYNYSVKGYIGKIKYDEKYKDGTIMEAGIYDSLKIVIGQGKGENWWSLLFPNSIEGINSTDIISDDNIDFSFGILDFIKDIFN